MNFANLLQIERQIAVDAVRAQPEFAAFRDIKVELELVPQAPEVRLINRKIYLGDPAFDIPALLGFHLRYALELVWLRRRKISEALAGLAACRAAALFIQAEFDNLTAAERAALPAWVAAMASEVAPSARSLQRLFCILPGDNDAGPATAAEIEHIRAIWNQLGTAEALMETGGDIRLQRDPRSALNGYGCSHRPRPWAITFASSTASSSSERGYIAADLERLKTTAALLAAGTQSVKIPIRDSLAAVRSGLSAMYGLSEGSAVVLAASGTDTELLALALTHLSGRSAPILNILIAPEETGRGVPMAARGLHFAVDTALGHAVSFEAPIAGFRPDTELANIYLRDAQGGQRSIDAVEAELAQTVADSLNAGKRVILHVLDLSKTGQLAPRPAFLAALRAQYGAAFDIVVDACQARLSARSVQAYLALDAVVLITGSKFFTGPPFAGALLLPEALARRLDHAALPEGLDAYFGRDEFPENCQAAASLPPSGNYGLSLRWHAALAEMRAFAKAPLPRRAEILAGFAAVVRAAIAANPALTLLEAPAIARNPSDEPWERLPSLLTFSLRAPHDPRRCLTPVEARSVYLWLNADLSQILPGNESASRICHIGQPVRLPQQNGSGFMGVLRVSAGARLISGEPSHKGLAYPLRIQREFADLQTVFEKIALILRNWQRLQMADPMPRYRAAGRQTAPTR
jgi:hypothetical protein